MNTKNLLALFLLFVAIAFAGACSSMKKPTISESRQADLVKRAKAALDELYESSPAANSLRSRTLGILVFPDIIKAGVIVGGSGGNGIMFSPKGEVRGYYNLAGVSYGLQFGAESYSQAMFLTTPEALKYLDSSAGWSIGAGPHVVVVDKGKGKELSSTTLRSDVYAFIYGQEGLMGALGVQGQKITKLQPSR